MTGELESFPPAVIEQLGHYVYRLVDPRNGETFYVGKGQGDRVFAHVRNARRLREGVNGDGVLREPDESKANRTRILEIEAAGLCVGHVIHRHNMSSETALAVEAALIDAYPGLENRVAGHESDEFGSMHAAEVVATYQVDVADFNDVKAMLISVNRSKREVGLYEAVRFAWRLDVDRARQADVVLATVQGVIRAAFIPTKWMRATSRNFPERAPSRKRWGFEGFPAPSGLESRFVGKRVPDSFRRKGAANPIRYSWLAPAQQETELDVAGDDVGLVGDTGFEPVTSAMSTQRSNHLS